MTDTIDDTMFVKNQATNVEDEGSLLSPETVTILHKTTRIRLTR
jgi:hypothetical protein